MPSADSVIPPFVLSFKEGIELLASPGSCALLQTLDMQMPLEPLSQGMLAALRVLSSDGATAEQLMELVAQHDGVAGLPKILAYLQRFIQRGMLCHTVTWDGGRLATIIPISSAYQWRSDGPVADARYVMSRFAYLHKDGKQFVLESPLAHAKIVLHDWRGMALLHTLATSHSLEELCNVFQDLPQASIAMFMHLLLGCQALSGLSDAAHVDEEQPTLTQWNFHDLLFHTRSRMGRHTNPCGATFRFLGKIDPLPVVKPTMSDETICLYKPDVSALKENDIPFARVLEERRSIRKHGEQPITAEQLGEFLYRTARIRALPRVEDAAYERSNRPYPSGGACYELELYVIVNICTGLPSGLFHYCPKTHQLYKLAGRTREVEALLEVACYTADQQDMPQILIILSSRFHRVMWKYDTMAYAVILKHVGVLYQTMYLVATAMGLAPCGLGSGNSDLFAAAVGTDYYAETSVGEFMLGSKGEGSQAPGGSALDWL